MIVYNEGEHCRLTIFEALGLSAGRHLQEGLRKIDTKRVKNAYIPGNKNVINIAKHFL